MSDPFMGLLALLLVIGVPALIFWRLGWFEHQKEKTDFGFDKPEHMRSWEGVLYVVWNWKSYTAKALWLVGTLFVWYESNLGDAITWFIFGGLLVLLGKFWELFKQ